MGEMAALLADRCTEGERVGGCGLRFLLRRYTAWLVCGMLLTPLLPVRSVAADSVPGSSGSSLSLILVPERNVFELRSKYKHITNFLADKLGVPVAVQVADTYSEAATLLAGGKVDAGFLGSLSYVNARRLASVEPLVRPVSLDERSVCRSYIFTRKEDAWKDIAELKGRRLIMVDKASTTGFFFPVFSFRNSGIRSLEEHFSKIIFSHSHDVAVWSVFRGEADIGAAKDEVFLDMVREYPEILERVNVVARSGNLPNICLAVRPGLDSYLKEKIRFLLLEMDKTVDGRKALSQFGALSFVRTIDADFDGLRAMLQEVEATDPRWLE